MKQNGLSVVVEGGYMKIVSVKPSWMKVEDAESVPILSCNLIIIILMHVSGQWFFATVKSGIYV